MSLNVKIVTPDEALEFIVRLLQKKSTRHIMPMLHGDPGIGKTTIIERAMAEMRGELTVVELMNWEPSAILGLERIDPTTGTTVHARPSIFPPYTDDEDAPLHALFFDELLACSDVNRKAAMSLFRAKRAGQHKLGKNVVMIGAGNTAESGTIIYEMDTATRRRMLHMLVKPSPEQFLDSEYGVALLPFLRRLIADQGLEVLSVRQKDIDENLVAFSTPANIVDADTFLRENISAPRNLIEIGLYGLLGADVAQIVLDALDRDVSGQSLLELVAAKPEDRIYPDDPYKKIMLVHNLVAYAGTPEKVDQAVEVAFGLPDHDEVGASRSECLAAFFSLIEKKLMQHDRYMRYALDPRFTAYLAAKGKILDESRP